MLQFQGAEPGSASAQIWDKLKTIQLPVEKDHALQMVRTQKYAFMTDESQLEYVAATDCADFVTTGYVFNTGGLAFAVAKDKPYLHEFSYK